MKRAVLAILIVLALVSAALGETFSNGEYSFVYPDGWTLDTVSYLADNNEDYEWLGDFYNDVYWGSCFIENDTAFEGFSLKDASDDEWDEWVNSRLRLLSGYEAEMYGDAVSESGIPFIFYTLTNEGNNLLEASTCISGWDVVIDLCMYDGSVPDSGCYTLLEDMVKSFFTEGSTSHTEDTEEPGTDDGPADEEEIDPRTYSVAV